WREHKTSPVRDERTHRSSLIISVAPPELWPFSTLNPRLKPWATFGRPYRDFGIPLIACAKRAPDHGAAHFQPLLAHDRSVRPDRERNAAITGVRSALPQHPPDQSSRRSFR